MIFVTVGMHTQGFERLIKKMDEIAGKIEEDVIMQIGSTNYQPKNSKFFRFRDYSEIPVLIREARAVVCHGGAGTIINALEQGIPVIAVPRLKRYNEAIDNHQIELVDALAKEGKILAIHEIEDLEIALQNISPDYSIKIGKCEILIYALRQYLSGLDS